MVVIGDPGSGKTTSLQQLTLNEAKKTISKKILKTAPFDLEDNIIHPEIIEEENFFIPVFIKMNQYKKGITLQDLILNQVRLGNSSFNVKMLNALLEKGNFLLIFDGINEVDKNFYNTAIIDLRNFLQQYYNNKFVFSSRSLNYNDQLELPTVEITKLTNVQIDSYTIAYLGEEEGINLNNLLNKHENRAILELGRNSFLLKMIVILYKDCKDIPANRGKLFDYFLSAIFNWEGRHGKSSQVDIDTKIALLSRLGYEMVKNGIVRISKDQADQILEQRLLQVDRRSIYNLTDVYQELRYHGLLNESDGEITFMHQSIQEYFCARELRRKYLADSSVLIENLKAKKWDESVILMIGILDKKSAAIVLKAIVNHDPAFSAKCYKKTEMDKQTERELIDFLKLKASDKEEFIRFRKSAISAISEIGSEKCLEILIELMFSKDNAIYEHTINKIGEIGTERAISAFSKLFQEGDRNDRLYALRALRQINEIENPEVFLQLLGDEDIETVELSIEALSKVKGDRHIQALINLTKRPDKRIRAAAIKAISNFEGENVTNVLLERLEDNDHSVVTIALDALAKRKIYSADEIIRLLDRTYLPIRDFDKALTDIYKKGVKLLEKVESKTGIDKLIEFLGDIDHEVRDSAQSSLNKIIKTEEIGKVVSDYFNIPQLIPMSIIVDKLTDLLDSNHPTIMARAAYMIGRLACYRVVGFIGIQMKNITAEKAQSSLLPNTAGVIVTNVVTDSPAARSGIEKDDILVKFNDITIKDTSHWTELEAEHPGKAIDITFLRNAKSKTVKVASDALTEKTKEKIWSSDSSNKIYLRFKEKDVKDVIKKDKLDDISKKLIELIFSKDRIVGISAAYSLSKLRPVNLTDRLVGSLEHEDDDVVRNVVYVLGEMKVNNIYEKLFQFIKHFNADTKSIKIAESIYSIGKIKGSESRYETLIKLFFSGNEIYSQCASYAIQNECRWIMPNYYVDASLKLLNSNDLIDVIYGAMFIKLTGMFKYKTIPDVHENTIKNLETLISIGNYQAKAVGVYALETLNLKTTVNKLDILIDDLEDALADNLVANIIDDLIVDRITDKSINVLGNVTKGTAVRKAVLKALCRIKDKREISKLTDKLIELLNEQEIRGEVIKSLGEIGDIGTIEKLKCCLSDDNIKDYADEAMARIADRIGIRIIELAGPVN